MRECPSCHSFSDVARDYCDCGEYLRWEPTGETPVLSAAPAGGVAAVNGHAATPVGMPALPETEVPLTLLTEAGERLAPAVVRVDPGQTVTILAHVRNQQKVVDHFALRIEGIPDDWWTVERDYVFLTPFGHDGTNDATVQMRIHPPRSPEARAREWSLRVTAFSRTAQSEVARAAATLEILPFHDWQASATPQRRRGPWRARYAVELRNDGNIAGRARIVGSDDQDGCRLSLPDPVEVEPGASTRRRVVARPKRPILIGAPVERRLELAVAPGEGAPPRPVGVAWNQRPWLPRWLALAVPLLAALVAAVLLMHVRVPEVTGLPLKEAQLELESASLGWKPPILETSKARPGTVLRTIPEAGAWRRKGGDVTLVVATDDAKAKVPRVKGKTYEEAVMALAEAGFRPAQKVPEGGADVKVARQVPAAGRRWPRKRPVELVFAKPAKKDEQPPKEEGRPGKTGAKAAVPPVTGLTLAAALEALRAKGLSPETVREISDEPVGRVLGTSPGKGKLPKDGKVVVRVSAGFPVIAYDDGSRLRVARGRDGAGARRMPVDGEGRKTQPAWTPDGSRLVYRAGSEKEGRLWIAPVGKDGVARGGRPLTEAGHDDRRPAVSPDGTTVAFARGDETRSAHRLCFVAVTGGPVRCAPDIGVGLSRPTWSRDGRTLAAVTDTDLAVTFTRSGGAWRSNGQLLIDLRGTIKHVAWSSTGRLAIAVVPRTAGSPTVYVAAADALTAPKPLAFTGTACELAWRPDGRELAVAGREVEGRVCGDSGEAGAAVRLSLDGRSSVPLGGGIVNPAFRPLAETG